MSSSSRGSIQIAISLRSKNSEHAPGRLSRSKFDGKVVIDNFCLENFSVFHLNGFLFSTLFFEEIIKIL